MNRTALLLVLASIGSATAFACGGSPDSGAPGDSGSDVDASIDANGGAVPPPDYRDAGTDAHRDASPDTGGGKSCAPGTKSCGDRCVPLVDPATGCAAADCAPCSFKNAGATCDSAGACAIGACTVGFGDCNTDAKDGCEVDTTTADHCGSCTTTCSASAPNCAPSGATYACSTGCPASAPTLCGAQCVDLATSATHCGTCANDCGTVDHGQMTCAANKCVVACAAGFHGCGATCAANTATATCGGSCGSPCAGAPNASATCDGVSCGYACNAGYTDCNSAASDGCEAHFQDDPKNCGACGHSCQGGACLAGQCQAVVLASGRDHPYRTYVSGGTVFYSTYGSGFGLEPGQIESVLAGGGAPPKIIAPSQSNPSALTLVGGEVYWLNLGNALSTGGIQHCPITGCPNSGALTLTSLGAHSNDMVLFGSNFYVAEQSNGSTRSQIYSTGTSAAVASAQSAGETFTQITADGTYIYWTDAASGAFGAVYRCNPSSCSSSLTQLGAGISNPYGIAVDTNYVYWSSLGDGSISRCALHSTTACDATASKLVSGEHGPYHLAVDASGIYWANHDDGTIRHMPLTGGTATTLATGQSSAQGISLDATTVYWANDIGSDGVTQPNGTVMKVAK